ncbi:hypothetical protein [Neomoorella thermoacetica]|uniref:hypothetical protein n=1 Tax=Neomoorella thermoacetica TaxID=1525 RepID=UPI0008FB7817|nr:hypothetical protein [Moorella thermoacetica]APC08606.1 hypothetical protein MTJW_14470 [Moorella thermoacetica]
MRRKLVAVLLLAAMFIMLPLKAWADVGGFKDKNAYQPPPGYSNLTYTRTQGAYIDFKLVDPFTVSSGNPESGFCVDFGPTGPYRSTAEYLFAPDNRDAQGNLIIGDGWGFINPDDQLVRLSSDLTTWLEALEWPKSGGWYNVTDAGDKQGSNAIRNIYYHMPWGSNVIKTYHPMPGYSKTNPYLVSPGPHYDTINDGTFDYTMSATFPNGQATYGYNWTKDGAIGFVHRVAGNWIAEVGYEHKKVAYTADLAVTQLTAGSPGSNGMAPFAAVIENLAPFDAVNAPFNLYVWQAGAANPDLVKLNQKTWNIPRGSPASGTPGSITITGFFPVPSKDYTLIAAIGAEYVPGAKIIPGIPGTWLGDNYNPSYQGRTPPGIGPFQEPYYDNNVKVTGSQRGLPPPPPPGGQQPSGNNDLAVTDLKILDASTGQEVTSPSEIQNLKAKATFTSTFDVGGWARLRLYEYDPEYKRLDLRGQEANVYFEPHAQVTHEWNMGNIGLGQHTLIASIDYYNNGNDPGSGWKSEKFDGKYEESTYSNNKMSKDLTGSEAPPRQPMNLQQSNSVWYPPLVWVRKPVYETYTEDVYGWRKVPFYKDPAIAKVRVRLIQ